MNTERREHVPSGGFTLIETLVAVSLLTVAIVAPMSLVAQSLSAAIYARDQVTAYSLAQEGIEGVRAIRDGNILINALQGQNLGLLDGIPTGNQAFTIDATQSTASAAIQVCASNPCPPLTTDGTLYGYGSGWSATGFTRTMSAAFVGSSAISGGQDAIRVSATVSWRTPGGQTRSFTIYENMYSWIASGAAQ